MPTRSLVGHVPGLTSCSCSPRPVSGLVDLGALDGTFHTSPLPVCGLGGPSRCLWTATDLVEFTCSLLPVARPGVTVGSHTGPATGHVTVTGPFSPLTVHTRRRGAGGEGGVTGIARRLLLPPGIAATLGRE